MIQFSNLKQFDWIEHGMTEIGDAVPEGIVQGEQVHKTGCAWVSSDAARMPQLIEGVDTLATAEAGVTVSVRVADCVPLVFVHPQKRVVGVIHAGWRGTALAITRKTLEWLRTEHGIAPQQLVVGIGPAIGPDDFVVGQEVARQFPQSVVTATEDETGESQFRVDLWQANIDQLIDAGVSPKNIEVIRRSTFADDKLYSARRGDTTDRNIAWIQITS